MDNVVISALQKKRSGYLMGGGLIFYPYKSWALCGRRTHLEAPKVLDFATAI
jgi:hypothetical protein